MVSSEPQELFSLIKKIAQENEVAGQVTAKQGAVGVVMAYDNFKTVDELEKYHSLYTVDQSGKGRIFPFYDEDYESLGVDYDTVPHEGQPTDAAILEMVYHVSCLRDLNAPFSNFAHHLDGLGNEINSLMSFHPDYDMRTGQIAG